MTEAFEANAAGVPVFEAWRAMWDELEVVKESATCPGVEAYAAALGKLFVNGEVRHASFHIGAHPVFDWYASRGQFTELGLFKELWSRPAARALMPEPLADLNAPFTLLVFTQDASLAHQVGPVFELHSGGLRARPHLSPV